MPVGIILIAPLIFKEKGSFGPIFIVGEDDAAFAGRDDFVAVEAKNSGIA